MSFTLSARADFTSILPVSFALTRIILLIGSWRDEPKKRPIGLDYAFIGDRPAIHFEIKINHRRAAEIPRQPAFGRFSANDLIRQEWVKVVHCVDLRRCRIAPSCAEGAKPALHLTKHEMSFLPNTFWADITRRTQRS